MSKRLGDQSIATQISSLRTSSGWSTNVTSDGWSAAIWRSSDNTTIAINDFMQFVYDKGTNRYMNTADELVLIDLRENVFASLDLQAWFVEADAAVQALVDLEGSRESDCARGIREAHDKLKRIVTEIQGKFEANLTQRYYLCIDDNLHKSRCDMMRALRGSVQVYYDLVRDLWAESVTILTGGNLCLCKVQGLLRLLSGLLKEKPGGARNPDDETVVKGAENDLCAELRRKQRDGRMTWYMRSHPWLYSSDICRCTVIESTHE